MIGIDKYFSGGIRRRFVRCTNKLFELFERGHAGGRLGGKLVCWAIGWEVGWQGGDVSRLFTLHHQLLIVSGLHGLTGYPRYLVYVVHTRARACAHTHTIPLSV